MEQPKKAKAQEIKAGIVEGQAPSLKTLDVSESTEPATKTKSEAEKLKEIDQEVRQRLYPVGDKALVRVLPNEEMQQTQAGIFLPQEYSANSLDRAVLVELGNVHPDNTFSAPITKILDQFLRDARVTDQRSIEIFISKRRQDTHEYRYKDQVYLLVPVVFIVAVIEESEGDKGI